jgi:hypothetical protein
MFLDFIVASRSFVYYNVIIYHTTVMTFVFVQALIHFLNTCHMTIIECWMMWSDWKFEYKRIN